MATRRRRKSNDSSKTTAATDLSAGLDFSGDTPAPNPAEPLLAPPGGIKMRISIGEMTLSPLQYHTFKVGPFAAEFSVPEGKNVDEYVAYVSDKLEAQAGREFEKELKTFERRARQAAEHMRATRGDASTA